MKCPFCIKVCTKCKRILVAYKGNFGKRKASKDAFQYICKRCATEYNHSNKAKESHVKYNHSDKGKEYGRKYKQSEKGKEKQAKADAKYYDKYLEQNGLERGEGSYGEQKVRQILTEHEIVFSEQHRFDDCRLHKPLPFDFYIPSLNTIIEYDGEQHYRAVESWGGEEYYEMCKERDTIKNDYCRRNNIRLIRIPYWEFDNIETILSDLL